jgi:hypothetical protein
MMEGVVYQTRVKISLRAAVLEVYLRVERAAAKVVAKYAP